MPIFISTAARYLISNYLMLCCILCWISVPALGQPISTTALSATLTATPSVVSSGSVVSLSATVRGGTAPYSFTFGGPGAITATGSNTASVSGLLPGIQSFTLTARDSGTLASQTVTAVASVTVPGASLGSSSTICVGQSATLSIGVINGVGPFRVIYTSAVSSSTGVVSTTLTSYTSGNGIVVTPTESTTYTLVSVAAANGAPLPVGGAVVVRVNPLPTVSVLGSPVLCGGAPSNITATGGNSYTLLSASFPISSTTGAFTLFAPGAYTLVASDGVCSRPLPFSASVGAAVPNISLTASSSVLTCSIASVSLVATAGGANYSFLGPPGSSTQSGPSNVYVTNQPGFYLVVITGTNGCTSLSGTTVSGSSAGPLGTFAASGAITCANQVVSLSATGGAPGSPYVFAGNGLLQASNTGSVTVTAPGDYSVIITGANGCRSTLITTVFSNTAAPQIGLFAGNALTCQTPNVTVSVSAFTSFRDYYFSGPGVFRVSSIASTTVNTPGVYSVLAIGDNGCSSTASTTVSFIASTAPILSFGSTNGSNQLTCSLTSLTLVASGYSGPAPVYTFTGPFAGGTTFGSSNTLVVNQPGTYFVTATGLPGCSATAVVTVESNTLAFPPAVAISGQLGCPPSSVTLSTGLIGPTYVYTGPGGFRTTNITGNAVVSEAGLYMLVTTSPATGCTAVALIPVSTTCVPATPNPPVTGSSLAILAPAYNCQTGAITLQTSGGDGTPIVFYTPGIARATAESTAGVVEPGLRFDPKSLTIQATQSGRAVSYLFDLAGFCTGRARLARSEPDADLVVTVLGNPTTAEAVTVEVTGAEGQQLLYQVRDGAGRLLTESQTERAPATDRQLLRLGSASGLYLLTISTGERMKTVKVVRQ